MGDLVLGKPVNFVVAPDIGMEELDDMVRYAKPLSEHESQNLLCSTRINLSSGCIGTPSFRTRDLSHWASSSAHSKISLRKS
jgi:hypothetical protein